MKRLVYISSSQGEMSDAVIESILESARRNNASADVTGLLLFHDGCFFQILEGPAHEVDRVFATIRNDRRHAGVIVLERSAVSERAFGKWSMGFIGANRLSPDQKGSLIDLAGLVGGDKAGDFSSSPSTSAQIATFLHSFREFAPV